MLQWNIERGYKLSSIVEELKQIDADVIALQEVDIGCERSGSIDTGMLSCCEGAHMLLHNLIHIFENQPYCLHHSHRSAYS